MANREFRWNAFNLDKVAKHGVSPGEAEHVVRFAKRPYPRRHRKGTWIVVGRGASNRQVQVVFTIDPEAPIISSTRCPFESGRPEVAMPAKRSRIKSTDGLPAFKDGAEFDALTAAEKEKVWESYNRPIPLSETRAPTAAERARFSRIKRKAGRPRIGQGAKVVAVTLEKGFLKRVDAYAKQHDMKRAEMITRGLKIVMGEGEAAT